MFCKVRYKICYIVKLVHFEHFYVFLTFNFFLSYVVKLHIAQAILANIQHFAFKNLKAMEFC